MHQLDVHNVMEYMGPNGPGSLPYAHSDLLSFNADDIAAASEGRKDGHIKDWYPAVSKWSQLCDPPNIINIINICIG